MRTTRDDRERHGDRCREHTAGDAPCSLRWFDGAIVKEPWNRAGAELVSARIELNAARRQIRAGRSTPTARTARSSRAEGCRRARVSNPPRWKPRAERNVDTGHVVRAVDADCISPTSSRGRRRVAVIEASFITLTSRLSPCAQFAARCAHGREGGARAAIIRRYERAAKSTTACARRCRISALKKRLTAMISVRNWHSEAKGSFTT